MKTRQFVLASRPKGTPTLQDFRLHEIELPDLNPGDVLLEGIYYSVDPYMRGRMSDAKSYAPPFEVDKAIEGGVLATVLETKSELFKPGDTVLGTLPWQEKIITPEKGLQKIVASDIPVSYYLGVLGMTGLTAHIGLLHIGKPKEWETVVVSGAAGAVGVVAGQIAKIKGCRVVGIAGSEEKVQLLKQQFGFDEAINYNTTANMEEAIESACPNAVDIYFDNVGGPISDAVIANINFHGRIALCGQISLYNSETQPTGPRLQPILLKRSVLMQGFIVRDYPELFAAARKDLAEWVRSGQIKFDETIINGFDQLPNALLGLFKGENTGKMLVKA